MYQLLFTFLVILSPISSYAGLFDFQPTGQTKYQSSIEEKCPNFSGRWSGTCRMDRQVQPKYLEISQFKCMAWKLSDSPYFIYLNGEKVTTDTNLGVTQGSPTNKEIVKSHLNGDQVEMSILNYWPGSTEPNFKSTGVFSLKDSLLHLSWKNSIGQSWTCELKKQ